MIKKISLMIVSSLMVALSYAQQVTETTLIVNKEERPATTLQINETAKDVANALEWYFKENNIRMRKRSGLYTISSSVIPTIHSSKLDLFFNIEQVGKSKNKQSNVTLAVQTAEPQFVGEGVTAAIKQNIPTFLNSIPKIVADYQHALESERLKKEAEKAEKAKIKAEKKAAAEAKKAEEAKKKLEEHQNTN